MAGDGWVGSDQLVPGEPLTSGRVRFLFSRQQASLQNFNQGSARMEAVLYADASGSWCRGGRPDGEEGDQLGSGSNGSGASLDGQPGPALQEGCMCTVELTSQRSIN